MSENIPPEGVKYYRRKMESTVIEKSRKVLTAYPISGKLLAMKDKNVQHSNKDGESKKERFEEPVKVKAVKRKAEPLNEEVVEELKNRHDLDGYEKISKIGEGTYGVVYKARRRAGNQLVALKKIKLNPTEGLSTTTIREISSLKEIKHEQVIELLDTIQRDNSIYLVFNYYDVDLRRYMDKTGREGLTEEHVKSFMHQLLNGLKYCHSHRILHRDLKPQNILIDREGKLTIADLGLCRAFGMPMRTYTHQVITLWYRPPEILLGSEHYSTAVDMWSTGCIMAEMISLSPLFPGTSQIDQLFRIFRTLGTPTEAEWPGATKLPDYNSQFPPWKPVDLREALEKNQNCMDIPDSAYDLLKSLLTYNPVTRLSAKKACEHPFFFSDTSIVQPKK